jgi:hypothetical protein
MHLLPAARVYGGLLVQRFIGHVLFVRVGDGN